MLGRERYSECMKRGIEKKDQKVRVGDYHHGGY